MRQRLPVVVLAVSLALAFACSNKSSARSESKRIAFESAESAATPRPARGEPLRVGGSRGTGVGSHVFAEPAVDAPVPIPQEQKLIYQGEATLEVASIDAALARLRELTQNAGGYVTSETRSRDFQRVNNGRIECRIPAGKLDSITGALKSIGTVESLTVSTSDITEEYFDLEIRLRNQRALETRLLALLQRPANKLEDLLEAERELARVRGEIDQMEGRRRFWDNRVALSTLTITVHEPVPTVGADQGGALSMLRSAFGEAAVNFVSAIAAIIAFTGGLVPVLIAAVVVLWMLVRLWRWRRTRRAPTQVVTT